MIWQTPIYRFRIPEEDNSEKLMEIVIDVTGSAPTFKEPSDELKSILRDIFNSSKYGKIDEVLEFGAAKLKNIPFILEQGKKVWAVEFKELTTSKQTKKNLAECQKYKSRFKKLVFPSPFIKDKQQFDLGLLLNVPPVMPVPAERFFLLDLLYGKIKEGKYLLWVAQKEGSYKKIRLSGKNSCGDGIWMGKNRYTKTFYKHISLEDLDEMMTLYGFKRVQKFNYGGSDARLYQKNSYNLFYNIISPEKISSVIPLDKNIKDPEDSKPKIIKKSTSLKPIIPNPRNLSIENLYQDVIKNIPEGKDHAEIYHRVVSCAIARIFRKSLRNMDLKTEIKDGVKIIDTLFTNCADSGFFKNLANNVKCTYPIIEVKNYADDTKNPEIDQLNGRFNNNHGHFGILVCRHIGDEDALYNRCSSLLPDSVILFLTDDDIFELLELSRDEESDEISDFMDKKLRTLLFKKG